MRLEVRRWSGTAEATVVGLVALTCPMLYCFGSVRPHRLASPPRTWEAVGVECAVRADLA